MLDNTMECQFSPTYVSREKVEYAEIRLRGLPMHPLLFARSFHVLVE